jgi:hypothetical protein
MNTARTYIPEDEEQKDDNDALVSVPKDDRTPGADDVTQNVLDVRISCQCGSSMVHGVYHYAIDGFESSKDDSGVHKGPYPATCCQWVKG